jgi:hypothetical protein
VTRRRITHHRAADGPDPVVTEALRETHAPPATPGYWDGLEARIMAHVRTARDGATALPRLAIAPALEWWQVMSGWVGAGAWAAGVAAVVAGAALVHSRAEERRVAYAAVLEATSVAPGAPDAPAPGTPATAVAPGAGSEREATLRYLLSPR